MAVEMPPDVSSCIAHTEAKDRLALALAAVLAKKRYEDVSVVDLAAEAGVSRSTFYRSFESVDQLVLYGYCIYLEDILRAPMPSFDRLEDAVDFMAGRVSEATWKRRDELFALNANGLTQRMVDSGILLIS